MQRRDRPLPPICRIDNGRPPHNRPTILRTEAGPLSNRHSNRDVGCLFGAELEYRISRDGENCVIAEQSFSIRRIYLQLDRIGTRNTGGKVTAQVFGVFNVLDEVSLCTGLKDAT